MRTGKCAPLTVASFFHRRQKSCGHFHVEPLESRQMLSADVRSIDGSGNNLSQSDWGATGTQLLREAAAAYADGISAPAGADRPSARAISDAVAKNTLDDTTGLNNRSLSAFIYAWDQFIDHDLDLTTGGKPAEAFSIAVPTGDPSFDPKSTGDQVIPLNRSEFDPSTGTSKSNPRQQTNDITAWLDGSVVYGSDAARAAALRSFVGGQLKTSDGNLMPLNEDLWPNANDAHLFGDNELFLAGDVRGNENIELTAIQTLFVREHNRLAASFAQARPSLNDEQLYQLAKKTVTAEIESITYNQFLPALLGNNAIDRYRGYDPTVNPDIATEFSTAAYRFGHSMLGNDVEFLDDDGEDVHDEVELANAFFNPKLVQETGIDPILKYLASDRAQEVDTKVVDSVRDFLFGPPGSGGLDLAALNIQRGRDHGLSDYNTTRAAYGLPRVKSFDQITSDPELQQQLAGLYGSVDNIDLWVGGLAENHVAGSSVGPLIRAVLSDQFERIRDGDRFWFENTFQGQQLDRLEHTTLADVIRNNTTLTNLQDNVFVFDVTLSGKVSAARASANDAPRSFGGDRGGPSGGFGRFGRFDLNGLAGWTVELQDADGNVLQTATTANDGSYSFTGLDLGTYRIREVVADDWAQISPNPADIHVTEGMTLTRINFRNADTSAIRNPARPGDFVPNFDFLFGNEDGADVNG